jgi:hypothetical protein
MYLSGCLLAECEGALTRKSSPRSLKPLEAIVIIGVTLLGLVVALALKSGPRSLKDSAIAVVLATTLEAKSSAVKVLMLYLLWRS